MDRAQDEAKFVDGRLPEELGIRIAGNDGATFVNFNLARLESRRRAEGVASRRSRTGLVCGTAAEAGRRHCAASAAGERECCGCRPRARRRRLSEWGLFGGRMAEQRPAAG